MNTTHHADPFFDGCYHLAGELDPDGRAFVAHADEALSPEQLDLRFAVAARVLNQRRLDDFKTALKSVKRISPRSAGRIFVKTTPRSYWLCTDSAGDGLYFEASAGVPGQCILPARDFSVHRYDSGIAGRRSEREYIRRKLKALAAAAQPA